MEPNSDLQSHSTLFVRSRNGSIDSFLTSSGVLQGGTLFLIFFILIVDYVLRRRLRENNSSSCLLITSEILRVGMQANGTKTKVLHFGLDNAQALHLPAREVIIAFADFSYLGSHLMSPDTMITKQSPSLESCLFIEASSLTLETPIRECALDASHRALLRYAIGVKFPQRYPAYGKTRWANNKRDTTLLLSNASRALRALAEN